MFTSLPWVKKDESSNGNVASFNKASSSGSKPYNNSGVEDSIEAIIAKCKHLVKIVSRSINFQVC